MPSPEVFDSAVGDWFEQQHETLRIYSNKIEACICHSDWEILAVVLESREDYLRRLFASSVVEERRSSLKQLAESVLRQDELFKVRVEEQKRIVANQQKAIDHGLRAVRAYNNQ